MSKVDNLKHGLAFVTNLLADDGYEYSSDVVGDAIKKLRRLAEIEQKYLAIMALEPRLWLLHIPDHKVGYCKAKPNKKFKSTPLYALPENE